jgi:hypothetical protein
VLVLIEFAGKVGTPASRQLVAPSAALGAPKKRVCSSRPTRRFTYPPGPRGNVTAEVGGGCLAVVNHRVRNRALGRYQR